MGGLLLQVVIRMITVMCYYSRQTVKGINSGEKTFGLGRGYSVQQTVDGGFIVTGHDGDVDFVVLLLKTDGQGNEQWEKKTFGLGRGYWSNKR